MQLVQADLHDDAQLARLVAGSDAVINLVAMLHGDERRFRQVHVELPQRLARACRAAGVKRVVHVSALGVERQCARAATCAPRPPAKPRWPRPGWTSPCCARR